MKKPTNTAKRIVELRRQIEHFDHAYYVLDRPEISDYDYDKLFDELKILEESNPDLITSDSPTRRVGGKAAVQFTKKAHRVPMLSLQNSYSPEDILAFDERIKKILNSAENIPFFCEPKLDGLAIELVYTKGQLTHAITRGDGLVGENVTPNILTIKVIPLKLKTSTPPDLVEIRGELVMHKADFAELNQWQEENGLSAFANPRNAAAGSIRQLDAKITASRSLRFYAYALGATEGVSFSSQAEMELAFEQWGLPTIGVAKPGISIESFLQSAKKHFSQKSSTKNFALGFVTAQASEAVEYYAFIESIRHQLVFEIDGVVIKTNSLSTQEELGLIARSPRWATAAKFQPEQAETKIVDIQVQVGRTGALTPVAIMEPVKVGGVKVTHATLHNQDEIDRKDVRIGDSVVVQRAGDVIPEVVEVILSKRPKNSQAFKIPDNCPTCGQKSERPEGEAISRCVNAFCDSILKESLKHFVSRRAMNIDKLGDKIIDHLVDAGLVRRFSDLYLLTQEALQSLDRQGEKSATNIVASINTSRTPSLARFIFSLGIRFVGEQTAKNLAHHFGSIEDLMNTDSETLLRIEGVGPKVAASVAEAFAKPMFREEVNLIVKNGVHIESRSRANTINQVLAGLSIVVTGTLPIGRDEIKDLIDSLGGKCASSVSKKTNFVLAGEEAGSKLDKARDLGVNILDWDGFQQLIKNRPE